MKLIGITGYEDPDGPSACVNTAYVNAFTRPECAAIIIPQFVRPYREFLSLAAFKAEFRPWVDAIVGRLDGLVLSGGRDLHPTTFDDSNAGSSGCDILRDYTELALLEAFAVARKPILGICRGHQLIARYLGLSNFQQDITECGELHQQITLKMGRQEPMHDVYLRGNLKDYISEKAGEEMIKMGVTSMHHQGLTLTTSGVFPTKKKELAAHGGDFLAWYTETMIEYEQEHGISILATTRLVIEAFEKSEARMMGIQFHGEETGPKGMITQYWIDHYLNPPAQPAH